MPRVIGAENAVLGKPQEEQFSKRAPIFEKDEMWLPRSLSRAEIRAISRTSLVVNTARSLLPCRDTVGSLNFSLRLGLVEKASHCVAKRSLSGGFLRWRSPLQASELRGVPLVVAIL